MRAHITEYLDVDLDRTTWCCRCCGGELVAAEENYKRGCMVYDRDPREIHRPTVEGAAYSLAPDPEYCRILEYYCPHCFVMLETEYLPPGHPINHDIRLDIDALKRQYAAK